MTEPADYGDRVTGLYYTQFLANLHERLRPQTYLEIGVQQGATLMLANCPSIAIDPRFSINSNVIGSKHVCLMFQETSDRFFENRDPASLLGGPVEMAFVDGMHLFEFVLRDFINVERHCRTNSLVLLHDCLPPHRSMTAREAGATAGNPERYAGWWTGDVWKIIPTLRRYRPDLSIELVDCRPTGVAMVTNLDPDSTVLQEAYREIVALHAAEIQQTTPFEQFWNGLGITPTSNLMTVEQLAPRYWL